MSGGHGEVRRFRARHGHRRRARGVPAGQDEGDGTEDWWDPLGDELQAEADGPDLGVNQNVGDGAGGNYFATDDAATSSSPPAQDGHQAAADQTANGQFEMTGPAMSAAAPSFPDPSVI